MPRPASPRRSRRSSRAGSRPDTPSSSPTTRVVTCGGLSGANRGTPRSTASGPRNGTCASPPRRPSGSSVTGGSVPTQWAPNSHRGMRRSCGSWAPRAGGLPVAPANNRPSQRQPELGRGDPGPRRRLSARLRLDLGSFLSAEGSRPPARVSDQCIGVFAGEFGALTDAEMVRRPTVAARRARGPLGRPADTMGTAGTTPCADAPRRRAEQCARPATPSCSPLTSPDGAHLLRSRRARRLRALTPAPTHTAAFPRFEASAVRYLSTGSPGCRCRRPAETGRSRRSCPWGMISSIHRSNACSVLRGGGPMTDHRITVPDCPAGTRTRESARRFAPHPTLRMGRQCVSDFCEHCEAAGETPDRTFAYTVGLALQRCTGTRRLRARRRPGVATC